MNDQPTLQDVLCSGYEALARKRRLPAEARFAAARMMACRTPALGGHRHYCPAGHFETCSYNSCGHRACPQCAFLRMASWLERQQARLLACPHTHIIFTIPEELNELWLANRRTMAELLFKAVRDTVRQLLSDRVYLGATPGIISALHTWGSSLVLHPHIHCLVTCGGLTDAGEWQKPVKSCLLPAPVVKSLFRGKYLAFLRAALDRQQLRPPPGRSAAQTRSLLNRLGRRKWNVRVEAPYDHAGGVVNYLARYLRGGPISNHRILAFDGETVQFRVKDYRRSGDSGPVRRRVLTLAIEEFLRRVLMHVPVPRMHLVRYYGLYARNCTERLNTARERLGQQPYTTQPPLSVDDLLLRFGPSERTHCPHCHRALVARVIPPVSRAPPRSIGFAPAA